ncbi:MAG: hypothetical protein KC546_17655 [Anaerolineae bacterium]|nr:hypothetical protein [Anaerolineae bacterium]MCA9890212.1 hypothetical protein [Anaerolineae bacterium]MCA9894287.1 hypothetical protein [Anaerolineae bacterium]MCB9458036.1 hypothetical protein [Anaerolineaceae bacterium]
MSETTTQSKQGTFSFRTIDDFIDVYIMADSRRDTIDAYIAKAYERHQLAIDTLEHYYTIYDVSSATLPTPYAISKAGEVARQIGNTIDQSCAIVTSTSFIMSFVRSILNLMPSSGHVKNMFFSDIDAAVAWIREEQARLEATNLTAPD